MRVIASRLSLLQSSRTVWFLFTSVIFHLAKIIEWIRVLLQTATQGPTKDVALNCVSDAMLANDVHDWSCQLR
jgi:hypothetical protein